MRNPLLFRIYFASLNKIFNIVIIIRFAKMEKLALPCSSGEASPKFARGIANSNHYHDYLFL